MKKAMVKLNFRWVDGIRGWFKGLLRAVQKLLAAIKTKFVLFFFHGSIKKTAPHFI